jgi:pimeloyl-ACP methyl ester carboxylesterase
MTKHRYAIADGQRVFYRAAGLKIASEILLLHRFLTSPHMHDLIPSLADSHQLVAPDLAGFGFSDAPDNKR